MLRTLETFWKGSSDHYMLFWHNSTTYSNTYPPEGTGRGGCPSESPCVSSGAPADGKQNHTPHTGKDGHHHGPAGSSLQIEISMPRLYTIIINN